MLAHGLRVDFADGDAFGCVGVPCCREFAVVVLAVSAPAACPPSEMAAELGPLAGATAVPVPFAEVVPPGFGVVLGLDDDVGVGVGDVGVPVGVGDPVADGDPVAAGD